MREPPSPRRALLLARLPVSATILAIAAAGLVLLVVNHDQPIVRNSFVYAKAASNILANGWNPLPVVADLEQSCGKPIGFALLSAPFVASLGPNVGTKVASFLGTVGFLFAAWWLFRRLNERLGLDRRLAAAELVFLFANPLVAYQFWSAHPDTLLAAEVVVAFVLSDIVATDPERDTRPLIPLLGVVIYAAILTKLYGLILCVVCPLYIALHPAALRAPAAHARGKLVLLVAVFGTLGAAVLLARAGLNPTLSFHVDPSALGAGSGGGYSQYLEALGDISLGTLHDAVLALVVTLVVSFHALLLFWLVPGRGPRLPLGSTVFAGIFVLGLLLYPATGRNLRYFIPILPFAVVSIVAAWSRSKRGPLTSGTLWAYAVVAALAVPSCNLESARETLWPLEKRARRLLAARTTRLDSLRLDQHLELAERIERINRVVEPDGTLFWLSSYYGAATHGAAHSLGVRADIDVRDVRDAADVPNALDGPVHLTAYGRFRSSLDALKSRFDVELLAPGLVRLAPR